MRFPRRTRSITLRWLALALASVPVAARAQDTARVPATTATRVSLPGGTTLSRPAVTRPAVTAPSASAGTGQQIVTVPDLDGRTVAEARRLLSAAGLVLGSVTEVAGEGTPGTVMRQQPRAGSAVAAKSDVRVWLVSEGGANPARPPVLSRPPVQGPPIVRQPPAQEPRETRVTVPRLVGRTIDEARGVLARVNLEVASVGEAAGSAAPGTVVRQSPQAGSAVAPESGVQLWVVPARVAQQPRDTLAVPAAPARRVVVPTLAGLSQERAEALVRRAGLRTGKVRGEGLVIGHTFEAGQSVAAGSIIDLSLGTPAGQVAARPDPPATQPPATRPTPPAQTPETATPPVTEPAITTPPVAQPAVTEPAPIAPLEGAVPDVRRLALSQAQAELAAAGFTAAFDRALADSSGWIVSAQQPSPGGTLAAGGVVALLLDPPAAPPVAAGSTTQPPPANGTEADAPAAGSSLLERKTLWISLAALLLIAAAAMGARRMRAPKRVLPIAGVSARLRMDSPARVAVEGAPFGDARLRFRMNPGRTAARVSAVGPLFVQKEISGD